MDYGRAHREQGGVGRSHPPTQRNTPTQQNALLPRIAKKPLAVRFGWDGVLRWVGVWDLPMLRKQGAERPNARPEA